MRRLEIQQGKQGGWKEWPLPLALPQCFGLLGEVQLTPLSLTKPQMRKWGWGGQELSTLAIRHLTPSAKEAGGWHQLQ